MSDDTPTVPYSTPNPAGPPASLPPGPPHGGNAGRSRLLILILSIIGGLLLIAVVVLLTLMFARGAGGDGPDPDVNSSPSTSPEVSPSETPSTEPSDEPGESTEPSEEPSESAPPPPPPPVATGPTFTSFSPANNKSAGCPDTSSGVPVTFTWSSTGAAEAAIGVATNDAFAAPYETGLPPSGSYELNYQCSNATQTYTVSIRGESGQTNKTVTLRR